MSQHPMLLSKFTELTGRSSDEVRQKVSRGIWKHGIHVVKDPDDVGKLNVIWEGYLKWLGLEVKADTKPVLKFKSPESGKNGKVPKRGGKRKVDPYKV